MRRVTMILADTPRRTQPTSRLRHRVAVSLSGGMTKEDMHLSVTVAALVDARRPDLCLIRGPGAPPAARSCCAFFIGGVVPTKRTS
jgi:hypothetical protein